MARAATAAVRLLSGEREPVRIAVSTNIALSGLQTIQSLVLVAGDRVLLFGQTDATQNGIYTASLGNWFRASDARTSRAINKGVSVHIQEGTYAGANYVFNTNDPNIGTSAISIVPAMDETSSASVFPMPAIRTATARTGDRPHIRDWDGVAANGDDSDLTVIQRALDRLAEMRDDIDTAEPGSAEVSAKSLELEHLHLIDGPIVSESEGISLTGPNGGAVHSTIISRSLTPHKMLEWGPASGTRQFRMGLKGLVFQHRNAAYDHEGEFVVIQNITNGTFEHLLAIDGDENFIFQGIARCHLRNIRSQNSFRDTPATCDVNFRGTSVGVVNACRVFDLDIDIKPAALDYGSETGLKLNGIDGLDFLGLHVQNRNDALVHHCDIADTANKRDTNSSVIYNAAYIDRNWGDNVRFTGRATGDDYRIFVFSSCRIRAAGRSSTGAGQGDPAKGRNIFIDIDAGGIVDDIQVIGGDISQADFAGIQCADDLCTNSMVLGTRFRDNNQRNSASGGDLLLRGEWEVRFPKFKGGGALGEIINCQTTSEVELWWPAWRNSTALKPDAQTNLNALRVGPAIGKRPLEFDLPAVATTDATPIVLFTYVLTSGESVDLHADVGIFFDDHSSGPQRLTKEFTTARTSGGTNSTGGEDVTSDYQDVAILDDGPATLPTIVWSRAGAGGTIILTATGIAATNLNWHPRVTVTVFV